MHNDFNLGPPWPEQPHTYELFIRVADAGPSLPHLSTTATVVVHLVPWRASTVATRTHRTKVRGVLGPLRVWERGSWRVKRLSFPGGGGGKTFQRKMLNAKSKSGLWGG